MVRKVLKVRTAQVLCAAGVLGAAMLGACHEARATCYTPTDQTAGWKQAPIPDDGPDLAASLGIEQFRANELALVWFERGQGSMSLSRHHHGKTEYVFQRGIGSPQSADDWNILEVSLSRSLTGDKVDVIAHTPSGLVPVWLERREVGPELHIDWTHDNVYAVTVRIHHHLREHAVVTDWRAGVRMDVSRAPWLPPGFRAPRSLYYRHPGGTPVRLCTDSGRSMAVQRLSLLGTSPVPVRLVTPVR
jgi:hypothetical protein